MSLTALPFDAPLSDYELQADALLTGWKAGDPEAIGVFGNRHPKFLDDKIPWLERHMTDDEVRAVAIDRDDALSWAYGGQCTTMALLVSSTPPAQAGVQVPLVETLVTGGALLEPAGEGNWSSPLGTALVFGFKATADALVRLGAKVENVAVAAGLGRTDDVTRLLPSASAEDRHRALALAAQLGTVLVDKGARLDIKDTIYQSSPLGWAEYLGKHAIADYLRAHGAPR